tara:strand:- start:2307 stop:3245 length:939 start_codon:yes stop_codon:yes gene_type:complete
MSKKILALYLSSSVVACSSTMAPVQPIPNPTVQTSAVTSPVKVEKHSDSASQGSTKETNTTAAHSSKEKEPKTELQAGHKDFTLAQQYFYGNGMPKNISLALHLYSQAANMGHTQAMYQLSQIYKKGLNVDADPKLALAWLKRSATKGYTPSQYELGQAYQSGFYTERNLSRAIQLYKLAADKNHHAAQFTLALMYYKGLGQSQDYQKAMHYFLLAAQGHHTGAQYYLGSMYYTRQTQAINFKTLPQWYLHTLNKSAIPFDDRYHLQLAYVWFGLAVQKQYQPAKNMQQLIIKNMSKLDIVKANQWLNEWSS